MSEPATLQAWRGILFWRHSTLRDRCHCHELGECMTLRADGIDACGMFGLHHATFPVTDSTCAPDEYLAVPCFTSRRLLLILTLSCGPWIPNHDDIAIGIKRLFIAKSRRDQTS